MTKNYRRHPVENRGSQPRRSRAPSGPARRLRSVWQSETKRAHAPGAGSVAWIPTSTRYVQCASHCKRLSTLGRRGRPLSTARPLGICCGAAGIKRRSLSIAWRFCCAARWTVFARSPRPPVRGALLPGFGHVSPGADVFLDIDVHRDLAEGGLEKWRQGRRPAELQRALCAMGNLHESEAAHRRPDPPGGRRGRPELYRAAR